MQGASGKLNVSAGKIRVVCESEGDADLEQPSDGQKAKGNGSCERGSKERELVFV